MNMGGAAGYANHRDRTIACIRAGCDMLLFPSLPGDFHTLLDAVRSGELPEDRVRDAARHVLEFKARLGRNGARVLDYEWETRPDYDDDSQFFDGFHLDTARGLPEWTKTLFTDWHG